jgi:hypothetical protein
VKGIGIGVKTTGRIDLDDAKIRLFLISLYLAAENYTS